MSLPNSRVLLACAGAGVVVAAVAWYLRRRAARRIVARYATRVSGRKWYRHVVVTEEPSGDDVVRSLHLGSEMNEPESRVLLRADANIDATAGLRLKPHLQHSLLAFTWLERGFELEGGARAALIGVAGGALLHFWRECVPGGRELAVDAVELDGAVLDAARDHLALGACEPPHGRVTFHVDDGAAFLREAEDEVYDLLVVDLDMGALMPTPSDAPAPAAATSTASRLRKPPADPVRDMYRVLTSRGVLVVNEYSEEPPAARLESSLRLVRSLRRFFPRVHQIRTTTHHNVMLLAAVSPGADTDLATRGAQCSAALGLGGFDLGKLMAALPDNRHQVYHK